MHYRLEQIFVESLEIRPIVAQTEETLKLLSIKSLKIFLLVYSTPYWPL